MQTVDGFLLTRDWRDTSAGVALTFWAATDQGPLEIVVPGQEAVCFFERDRRADVERLADALGLSRQRWHHRELDLLSPQGVAVNGLYFRSQRDLSTFRSQAANQGVFLLESDIKPHERFLMERFISGGVSVQGDIATIETNHAPAHRRTTNAKLRPVDVIPTLHTVSLDVESSDLDGDLYSIALASDTYECVLLVDPDGTHAQQTPFVVESYRDETALLRAFINRLATWDPDVIIGWNVIGFDLTYLERRCTRAGIAFNIGRAQQTARILAGRGPGQIPVARIPGRVVLDGIETLRAAFWNFEDFSLEAVSRELLGRGKLVHEQATGQVEAIRALFANDKHRLASYNLEDCRLVLDIFAHADLVPFAIERARITGLALGRAGGSVAAFDHFYLPRLHRRGRVAQDPGVRAGEERTASPGGYVLDSHPGLYHNVLVLDFKSLYPSIIRTFQIDPYGLWVPGTDPVEGFLEAQFARQNGILPAVMTALWERRDEAKREQNAPLSQAVKIIMNACYGVLASTGCRFFDPRLASSITKRGHEIIRRSREQIEGFGHHVIYGDTDSLFVHLEGSIDETQAQSIGTQLAKDLNVWWGETLHREHQLASHLEVEFETHYLRFLMPTVRGSQTGTKKRYAGSVRTGEGGTRLIFKGLEAVRTDWTPLARNFQRELYRRVFNDEPVADFIETTDRKLLAGELDDQLVYRKRLRRNLADYQRNVPPHVQAARKQARPGRWVSYIITRSGPEPIENIAAVPDYEHYRTRQLAPSADGILNFLDTSFARVVDAQLGIF
ncbi:MAG: DNA polymerase-2 [Gammaproteobacteria bacterium]|jgi:DNA polymerase-2